ncbi:MAG TPA: hypothetical protein VN452_03515 [Longilinea sp.]|nr:hypothetical protein [Longilinea sp.]
MIEPVTGQRLYPMWGRIYSFCDREELPSANTTRKSWTIDDNRSYEAKNDDHDEPGNARINLADFIDD